MADPSGDGLDALTEGRPTTDPDEQRYGDPDDPTAAKLLMLPPKEAAAFAHQLWKDQPEGPLSYRRARWQVNKWRAQGRTNVFVQKTEDENRWQAWAPPYTAPPVPVLNKAMRLARRLTSIMFADDPVPEVVPDPEDQDAAEFAQRVLSDVQAEGQLDDLRAARRAFGREGSIYGSGFIRYFVDPKAGGRKPVRVMAKVGAVTAEAPFTGPMGEALPGDLVTRYVREDGMLTDTPAEAATRWMPAIRSEILSPPNVRFLPHDAEDLWDAEGVVIATMPTWGELLELWPELAEMPAEERDALFAFRPERARDLLGFKTDRYKGNEQIKRVEDKRVAVFTVYYKSCPAYPQGCYFVGLADRAVAFRGPWTATVEGVEEPLDIPLTQYAQFEPDEPDPYYVGLIELLGSGNEIRAAQVGHLMAYLDQFTNRKVFIPTNSILQPRSYQLLQGTAIPINPGGEPKFEDIPPFPREPLDLFTLMTEEMNDQSTLQQTAQGTEVQGVNSGRQAQVIVEQAQAGASDLRQNIARGYIRGCRIQLQLIRATYTVPQQIEWTGEDGQYRQKWWTGADLRSAKNVRLKRGSLAMMTPQQKLNMALQFKQYGLYDMAPDLFYETVANSLGPTVGLQDDPARQRIKRQLAQWGEGPPEGWEPPAPPVDPATGGPLLDPATGQPVPPPPAPELLAIFAPLPPDELQDVAIIRLMELKRFMQSTKYSRWPAPWRLGVDLEFQHMKAAAGVLTLQEQAMLEQQQAQAQAEETERQRQHEVEMAKAKQPEESDKEITRDPSGRMTGIRNVRREQAAASA